MEQRTVFSLESVYVLEMPPRIQPLQRLSSATCQFILSFSALVIPD